jgi:FAD/FMN-containing dehydrogenase
VNGPADFRGIFTADPTSRALYSEAAGISRIIPAAIAVPADADDVAALLRWASGENVPITARGSGSSMAGGAVGEGVILDLTRLDSIGDVDSQRRTIRVGPGAICSSVNDKAFKAGLRFPVDPSSARFALSVEWPLPMLPAPTRFVSERLDPGLNQSIVFLPTARAP